MLTTFLSYSVSGGELFERIVAEDNLTEKEAVHYMKQLLQALHHMHNKKIVHLDLKVRRLRCIQLLGLSIAICPGVVMGILGARNMGMRYIFRPGRRNAQKFGRDSGFRFLNRKRKSWVLHAEDQYLIWAFFISVEISEL